LRADLAYIASSDLATLQLGVSDFLRGTKGREFWEILGVFELGKAKMLVKMM
jgi:hypothetical protein